ncbi:MAG: hypothetical protein HQK49_08275 [Oligoflexia bacterium]|nr:hypothetical protein [Oligoflexia bacterium]
MGALKNDENFIGKLLNETIEENCKIYDKGLCADIVNLDDYFEKKSKNKAEEKLESVESVESINNELSKLIPNTDIFYGKYLPEIGCYRLMVNNLILDFPSNLAFFMKAAKVQLENLYIQLNHENDHFQFIKIFNSMDNLKKFETIIILFYQGVKLEREFCFICCNRNEEKKRVLDFTVKRNFTTL